VANKHGWSEFSPILTVLAATAPGAMTAPTLSYSSSGTSIRVAWGAPYDGGSPLTAYSVLIQHGDDPSVYSSEPTYCAGSSLAVRTARWCEIPLATLRAPPFLLTLGQLVYARVAASNVVGAGPYSPLNALSVGVQTEPSAPLVSPALVSVDETRASVSITPLAGLQAGNSPVLYYEVAWDRGLAQAVWSVYTVVSSGTTAITVRGLSSGATYSFKYRALNLHGWSPSYSPVLTITALVVPGQVSPVATSMDGASVLLEWEEPFTGGQGIPVTSYTVRLRDAFGTLAEYPLLCDGAALAVLSSRRCEIPMPAFTAPISTDASGANTGGLGLAQGALIVASVAASNLKGTGAFSALNSAGELAQTPPSAPPAAPWRGPATSESRLDVQWAFLTGPGADGGSPLLSYGLEVDDGAGGPFAAAAGASPETSPYTTNSKEITTAISSGLLYRVRLRAYNVHGWGLYSPVAEILAATLPGAPDEPTVTVVGTGVQISWSSPANPGGLGVPVLAYRVEIRRPDGTFGGEPSSCDGTLASVVSARSCTIPMSTLTSTDPVTGFSFAQGAEIAARVAAANPIGYGPAGPVSVGQTALAEVLPWAPPAAPTRGIGTGEGQIVVEWAAVGAPADGGTPVTSYGLQWDAGTGAFGPELTGEASAYPSTTYTQLAGLLAGGAYRFRYRAANKYGWGPYSAAVTILAADVPAQPAAVAASITDLYVKLSWAAPAARSAPIVEYEVRIRQSDGATFTEEATYCDGSRAAIVAGRYCLVPMATLRAAPYSLPYAALVAAELRARNAVGWSAWSTVNAVGAQIQTEPLATATPSPARGARTDDTRLEVEWAAMTSASATGGSPITAYSLEWDRGDGTGGFEALTGAAGSPYLATRYLRSAGVVAGTTYRFRLRAWNKWGAGGYSPSVGIEASTIPSAMAAPATAMSGTRLRISWVAPAARGNAVSAYTILIGTSSGGWATEPTHCDGAAPEIVAAGWCDIPLPTLRAAPFGLAFDDLVVATVSASNGNGAGPVSPPNTAGARIQTEPEAMAAPLRGPLTSETQLHV
jgi:hypothetical protein